MEQVGGACDVKLMRGLDEYLQGENAQRDTTTEKPRVMVAGSTHQADDDAAEKNPQYLAADIQSRLRAARVRPAVKNQMLPQSCKSAFVR